MITEEKSCSKIDNMVSDQIAERIGKMMRDYRKTSSVLDDNFNKWFAANCSKYGLHISLISVDLANK